MGKGVPLWKDLLYAVLIVGGVLGSLTLYTQVWPPMVVVESGSMMHPDAQVPYGRFGTIDPGDMVLVKAIDGPEDVETFATGGRERYGESGDVLVYYPNANRGRTPIIHRAMTWVDVSGTGSASRTYSLVWDGERLNFGSDGIYLPALGFDETRGFSRDDGYKPAASGFLTKGDNPVTNRIADQAMGLSAIVEPEWVQGKSRGELPWFGLIKLGVTPCDFPPCNQRSAPLSWTQVGYAAAPKDLWVMLAIALAVVVLAPLGYDAAKARFLARRDGGAAPPSVAPPPPGPAPPPSLPPSDGGAPPFTRPPPKNGS